MDNFGFTPSTGLLDTSQFPTDPASETAARQQFMTLFNQIKDYVNNTIKPGVLGSAPSGVVMDFAGVNAPSGWLVCDGAAVSRTVYADLFTAIGTTWGVGDGSTTFNLPNLTDNARFRRSKKAGLNVGTYQADDFKSHNHPLYGSVGNGGGAGSNTVPQLTSSLNTWSWGTATDFATGSGIGATGGAETRPVSAVFLPIIKI